MAESITAILDLEIIDTDLYRGTSPRTDLQRVFGGQVAGQALVAAGRTVHEDRHLHSLHSYFLRAGDPTWPIIYEVERVRDGRSFTTRRVVAKQRGKEIFLLSASFQRAEEGYSHQVPSPGGGGDPSRGDGHIPGEGPVASYIAEYSSIDLRRASIEGESDGATLRQRVWFRTQESLPDEEMIHVCVVAYASDLTLLGTALLPHEVDFTDVQIASLDHAMWFHRPFRADEWLLYDMHTPSSHGGRGLSTGHIFTAAGDLAVSVVQEGLMRPRQHG